MSITTIPNQPINFTDPEIFAACKDTEPTLKVGAEDPLIFQFMQDRCEDAEQYLEPIGPLEWIDNPGWTIADGSMSLVTDNGLSDVNESSWVAVIGTVYEVEVFVDSVQGDGVFIMVGGVQRVVNSPGLHKWTVSAEVMQGARAISVGDNAAIVITSFEVWEANRSFEVAIIQGGVDVAVYTPIADPEFFSYVGQHVKFIAALPEDLEGCFHLELRDGCEAYPVIHCSQPIELLDDCRNTLMLRVCLDSDGLGFVAGYFTVRLHSSLTNPTWEYESGEERLSNGFINRYYIDRQGVYQLSIETVSQFLHPFLALLPMFDHFYIGETAWSVDAEGYSPNYGDSQIGSGSVSLVVRKKRELIRRVLCDDLGEGCNPANDPICPAANAVVGTEYSGGVLFAFVEVFSNLGFFVSEAQWFLNGVEQTPELIGGTPGKYALGEVAPGDTVRVVFVDNQNGCTDDRGTFTVGEPTCTGLQITVTDETDAAIAIRGTDGFVTAISPSGVLTPYANADASIALEEQGVWCVYPSDVDGNASGGYLEMGIGFTGVDPVDFSPMNGSGPLSVLITNSFEVSGVLWTELTLPSLVGSNQSLFLEVPLPNLTTVNIPFGTKFANMQIRGAVLTSASIDVLCNALDTTVTGQAATFIGTAAATAASLANRDAYIANGNTITFSA